MQQVTNSLIQWDKEVGNIKRKIDRLKVEMSSLYRFQEMGDNMEK